MVKIDGVFTRLDETGQASPMEMIETISIRGATIVSGRTGMSKIDGRELT